MNFIYLLFIISLTSSCFSLQEKTFGTPEQADQLANKIIKATHQEYWKNTKVIQWTFSMGKRSHIWDRERELEYVKWDEYEVWLNLTTKKGIVKKEGELVEGTDKQVYLDKAWSYWINDSFWLNPIAKFYDEGVSRRLVSIKGDTALNISYSKGGLTPGDSYLWLINNEGLPTAWKLWVSIIPINGFRFSWENWQKTNSGVMIATKHHNILSNVNIDNVKGENSIKALFGNIDPFLPLIK
tara:strand:- start:1747 stop:2466 length:720 start_codon:yes stop_codon:yes gene_type:complete